MQDFSEKDPEKMGSFISLINKYLQKNTLGLYSRSIFRTEFHILGLKTNNSSMAIRAEMKDFTKKVLLLGIVLSFLINLIFTYISSFNGGSSTYAAGNDGKFRRASVPYLGSTGIAISMNI